MNEEDRFQPQEKLSAHRELSDFLEGKPVVPINIEVSPTHVCNATCPWCFYRGTHGKMSQPGYLLNPEIAKMFIREAGMIGVKALSWTGGGEPSIHPQFREFVDLANEVGLRQGMFTNAIAPIRYDPTVFQWIRVSKTEKPFPENRIAELREKTAVVGLVINYVNPENEYSGDQAVREGLELVDRLGLNYLQVRPALNLAGQTTQTRPPQIEHPKLLITKYKFADADRKHPYPKCFGYHFSPFVWSDGNVDVCAYHKGEGRFTLGNLHQDTLMQIIQRMPRSVDVEDHCQVCCKNHEINKLVNHLDNLVDKDFV